MSAVDVVSFKLPAKIGHNIVFHSTEPPTEWKRIKTLGIGGQGSVDLEEETTSGSFRAIKKLFLKGSDVQALNINRELRSLIRVKNYTKLFVEFSGWYQDDTEEYLYIAMEFVPHGNLGEYLANRNPRGEEEAKDIAKQLLNGLAVLHEEHICHRDLKPQNVLVACLSPIHIKLADFGFAKFTDDGTLLTRVGTQGFLAPELLGLHRGSQYTNSIDIWALGCLIYHILTGSVPFSHTSGMSTSTTTGVMFIQEIVVGVDIALMAEYCRENIEFPTATLRNSTISENCIRFIKKLLNPDPRLRPPATEALTHSWINSLSFEGRNTSILIHNQLISIGLEVSLKRADELLCCWCSSRDVDIGKYLELPKTEAGNMELMRAAALKGYWWTLELLINQLYSNILGPKCVSHREKLGVRYVELLLRAAIEGSRENILRGLIHYIDYTDVMHFCPLILAAVNGKVGVVDTLLDLGVSIDAVDPEDHQTALGAAAAHGHADVAELLLTRGAQVNLPAVEWRGRTALQAAAQGGHLDIVIQLLSQGADVNAKAATDTWGRTALQAAAQGGYMDIVQLLLSNGADVNAVPSKDSGMTALQAAAQGGYLEVVQLLLLKNADINAEPSDPGLTAFQAAAESGHLDMIQPLKTKGADINAKPCGHEGKAALQAAAGRGHFGAVVLLLEWGIDINSESVSDISQTALSAAAEGGHLSVVELLLRYGAGIDDGTFNGKDGTALQAAAAGGHLATVQLLLSHDADINAGPSFYRGRTALQAAAEGGHHHIVQLLLNKGADVNAAPHGKRGITALQAAAGGGHLDTVNTLLRNGASTIDESIAESGQTALAAAAQAGHLSVVKILLSSNADVNAASTAIDNRTALQAAAWGGHFDVVRLLLSHGAHVNPTTSKKKLTHIMYGQTALQAAAAGGYIDIVQLLLSENADVNAVPSKRNPQTALQAAAYGGHIHIVKLLLENHANVDASYFSDQTAIQAAADRGHLDIVQFLVQRGANPDLKPPNKPHSPTALGYAMDRGHREIQIYLHCIGARL